MRRLLVLLSACAALACVAVAQTDDVSLGDVARKVRSEKKTSAGKVYDNDNLPTNAPITVLGVVSESSEQDKNADKDSSAAKKGAAKKAGEAKQASAKPKRFEEKLTDEQQQLDFLKRELSVLEGEQRLQAAGFYSDAGNRLRDPKAYEQQARQYQESIATKQKEIETKQQELETLKDFGRKNGVPTSVIEGESKAANGNEQAARSETLEERSKSDAGLEDITASKAEKSKSQGLPESSAAETNAEPGSDAAANPQ
jgi:hypothetical protein